MSLWWWFLSGLDSDPHFWMPLTLKKVGAMARYLLCQWLIWLPRGSGWTQFAKICDSSVCLHLAQAQQNVISFEWSSAICTFFPAMAETFAFNADIQQLMSFLSAPHVAAWNTMSFQIVLWLQFILPIFCEWLQFKRSRNREKNIKCATWEKQMEGNFLSCCVLVKSRQQISTDQIGIHHLPQVSKPLSKSMKQTC